MGVGGTPSTWQNDGVGAFRQVQGGPCPPDINLSVFVFYIAAWARGKTAYIPETVKTPRGVTEVLLERLGNPRFCDSSTVFSHMPRVSDLVKAASSDGSLEKQGPRIDSKALVFGTVRLMASSARLHEEIHPLVESSGRFEPNTFDEHSDDSAGSTFFTHSPWTRRSGDVLHYIYL